MADRDAQTSETAESWSNVSRVVADCLTCGEQGPEGLGDTVEAARQWARRHAEKRPGHHATSEVTKTRSYRVTPPGASTSTRDGGGGRG